MALMEAKPAQRQKLSGDSNSVWRATNDSNQLFGDIRGFNQILNSLEKHLRIML